MEAHLADLLEWGNVPPADRFAVRHRAPFTTVTMSSRPDGYPPMRPGGLFVAIRGHARDGHEFVRDAFANGASAAIVDHVPDDLSQAIRDGTISIITLPGGGTPHPIDDWPGGAPLPPGKPVLVRVNPEIGTMAALQRFGSWWRDRWARPVVAIAGSVGKTSTKDLVVSVLSRRFRTLGTAGNLNNELGLPITLLGLESAHEVAAVEIGISAPGEMATFAGLASPDCAVMTRIEAEHMEFLHDLETVAREEGTLVEFLRPGGTAVLNLDDPVVAAMGNRTRARVATYGEAPGAATRAEGVRAIGLDGIAFRLVHDGRQADVHLPLAGRHFVAAALAAAATGFALGCDWPEVIAGLEAPPTSPRVRVARVHDRLVIIDDTYNASPASCLAALDLLAGCDGTRVAVLGDMFELGEHEAPAHAQVGAYVAGRAHALVAVGNASRGIARAAIDAGMDREAVSWVARAADAPGALETWRHASGTSGRLTVLVKGSRGMRMEDAVRALDVPVKPMP